MKLQFIKSFADKFLIFVSIVVFSPFYSIGMNEGLSAYSTAILITVWFFIALLNELKADKFIFRVFASIFAAVIIEFIFFRNSEMRAYLLIFVIPIIAKITISSLVGFFAAKIYNYLIQKNQKINFFRVHILILFFITSAVLISVGIFSKNSSDKFVTSEIHKKYEFGKRIGKAIKNNQIKDFTNHELIQLNIVNDLYEVDGSRIINGYGGDIFINRDGNEISLIYTEIPGKEPCFHFYYVNSIDLFGFEKIKVDNVETSTPTNTHAIEKKKKEVCFSGKKQVTIEFSGDMDAFNLSHGNL